MADHGRNNQRRPPHFPGIFGVGFSLSPETCKGILACSLISSSATVPGFLVFSVCPQHVKSCILSEGHQLQSLSPKVPNLSNHPGWHWCWNLDGAWIVFFSTYMPS